jgi:hypothetical protein
MLLQQHVRELDIINATSPQETRSEYSEMTVTPEGHLKLTNERYKTRVRASNQVSLSRYFRPNLPNPQPIGRRGSS